MRWLLPLVALVAGCETGPALIGVVPAEGSARGNEEVVLLGEGFVEPVIVRFGGIDVPEVLEVTETEVRLLTAPATAGRVDVEVVNGDETTSVLSGGFAYTPLELSFAEAPPHYLPDLSGLDVVGAAAADFDLDGDPDVLVGVRDGDSRLLINTGSGELVDPLVTTVPGDEPLTINPFHSATAAVVARDLDRDGDVDVFACNGGGQVDQLFDNLDGTAFDEVYADVADIDGDECVLAAPLDLDDDGWTDLALVGYDGASATPYHLRVLMNLGASGTFGLQPAVDLEPPGDVEGEAVGEVTGDEGVVGSLTLTVVEAATGSGAGRLAYDYTAATGVLAAALTPPSVAEAPSSVTLAVAGDGAGHTLTVRLIDAEDEQFATIVGAVDWTGWQDLDLGDPAGWSASGGDGDLVLDPPVTQVDLELLAASATAGEVLLDDVVLGLADGRQYVVEGFERPAYLHAWSDDVSSLAAADLDGDGDRDLVLSSLGSASGEYARVLLNRSDDGAGAATADASIVLQDGGVLPVNDPVAAVTALDADGDGDRDVGAVTSGQDRLLINDGTAHFFDDSFAAMPVDWSDGSALAVADMDLDGLPDLVIGNHGAVDRLYLADGDGRYVDHTPAMPLHDRATEHVLVFDAEGDADLDILLLHDGEAPAMYVSVEDDGLD